MTEPDILTFAEVRKKIEAYMKIALNIQDFDITYARIVGNEWRVNIEWTKEEQFWTTSAAIALDVKTGELKAFQKNKAWTW